MVSLLANAENGKDFVPAVCLMAGFFILLHTLWSWLTGDITISDGGGRGSGFSPDTQSRIVNCYSNPKEFRSMLLTRLTIGVGAIVFGLFLLGKLGI